jgi:hypothetical protein
MRNSRLFRSHFSTLASSLALFGITVCYSPQEIRAQLLQGTISGTITDSTQAAIAGATVVARNEATNFVRETTTSEAGFYTLPDLPPGTYAVSVKAESFQAYTQTGVQVSVQTVTRVDAALTLGAVNQQVTVAAQANSLQTDRADVRAELGTLTLDNLPVPAGRNYQELFTTMPGVSPPTNSHSYVSNGTRSLQFSVNGSSVNASDTRVDGAGTRNFNATDVAQYIPSLEAIGNVNVSTNAFDADQSAGGGYINVTVKSGTNTLHGSAFWDHSDQGLAAYQWIANRTLPKLPYSNNQFGGTAGGPIEKDKVFYFLSYEGTRLLQGNAVSTEVPTAAMRAGDLSGSPTPIYDPLTGTVKGSGRMQFPGNIIPSSRIDPGIQALLALGPPNPNQPGTGALHLAQDFLCSGCQGNSDGDRDQLDGKISWNPTSKLSTFVRLGAALGTWANPSIFGDIVGGPYVSPTNIAIGTGGSHIFNGSVAATYVFNANLLLDAFVGYDRVNAYSHRDDAGQNYGSTLLGIPGLSTAGLSQVKAMQQAGMPYLAIDNFANLGPSATNQPADYRNPEKNFGGSINWLTGSHNIRAGFEADFQASNEVQYQVPTGSSTYITSSGGFHFAQGTTQLLGGPAGNDYNSFASFLLGLPQDAGKIYQFPDEITTRASSYGFYIRDRWQVTPKLTLSYGLRADYYPFPARANSGLEVFNPYTNTMTICGTNNIAQDCGITKDRFFLVPRLGLAYRLTDSTVLRAGYGIATDPVFFLGYTEQGRLNYPYTYGQLLLPPNSYSYSTTLRKGLPAVTPPDLSSGAVPVPDNVVVTTFDNSNYVRGYIQSYNLTLEQRVKNWVASAAYVGSRTEKQQENLQANWSPIGGGTAGEVLNQETGRTASTLYLGTQGSNKYDALQMRATARYGLTQLAFSYTFSKALGYPINPYVQIPQYYQLNYGPLVNDITHMFAATSIVELPFGKNRRWLKEGFTSKVFGGWQFSSVVTAHTGLPFTATASSSSLNAPFSSQFADCIAAPQTLGDVYSWYSKSSFAAPANGRFGTCGYDSLRQPGLVNADAGLQRKFRILEKYELSFRGEVFNVSNSPHHTIPTANTSVNSSSFMQATGIVSTGRDGVEQRDIRLTLHLAF